LALDPPVRILHEEGPCLVVNKPSGLLTQAPPGIDSLEVRIKAFLKARDAKPGNVYLGVPHRLDRPASGAMVFAKHVRAARRLAEQFEARVVRKVYWVYVEGDVRPAEGTWTDSLRKVPGEPRAEVVPADHPEGRQAILHYRVLDAGPRGAWLEIELETGRTHQIRVQAAARGHPVLGDAQYGSGIPFGVQYEDPRLRAIALHARSLTLRHPTTHEPVTVLAPLPECWAPLGTKEY
jgi:23S rRNA pseudouridine1911/1915/1917 synthase